MKCLIPAAALALTLVATANVHAGPFDPKFGSLEENRPDRPGTQFADIKGWKPLAHRWAGALNEKGEVVAIYDLSYPDLLSRFPFSVIGGRSVTKYEIMQMIWDSKFNPDVDRKLADKAVKDLQTAKAGPIDDGALPAGWHQSIKWKNLRMAAGAEPDSFRLSDIDILSQVKDAKKFMVALSQLETALNDAEGADFGTGLLNRIELRRSSPGTYELFYDAADSARGVSRPKKIADLASPKMEFFNAFKLELAKEAIDQAIDLITVPVVNGIVDTAVDRFFHFHKLVQRTHQHMALEMINSMQDGTGTLSSAVLNEKERAKAVEALSFAQSSMTTGWKWVWKKPTDEWNKDVKKQEEWARLGMDWLFQKKLQTLQLNRRFAISVDPTTQVTKLLILAKDKPSSKKGPSTAIDYSNPETPFRARVFMEVATAGVVFGTRFIPAVGSYVKKAYKEFVEKPYDKAKIWEGRLTAHLEGRLGEDHAATLSVLDKQRVNPLFQSRSKMLELIADRKQLLGLQ